ncbi:MAG: hypothetical protein ACKOW1_04155 [Novosphingobium sp.]
MIAFFASILAIRQLRLATKAQADQVQIARANLMLAIDKSYEDATMLNSRKAVRSLRNRAHATIEKQAHKDKTSDGKRKQIAEEFSAQLDQLWSVARSIRDEDVDVADSKQRIAHDRYSELMCLVNWMETVGMLCKRNLLPTPDILDLYDQVIVPTLTNFKNHVDVRRREEPYPNPRFMENAYWLHEMAVTYQAQRDRTLPLDPAKSPTKWS